MRIGLVLAVCGLLGLAGCSGGVVGGTDAGAGSQASKGVAGAKLTGVVHGGQNPISGARVYLFAAASGAGGAGQAAYGGNGIAASATNASVSLLTTGTLDAGGGATNGDYYVTTGADGSFSISGDYTCAAGQQVYLYVLGGDPGLGTGVNPAAGLMAALGGCPGTAGSTGNTFSSGLYVVVNEVSTVAAAYAMAGFATDATHVGSSGTALALTGIGNAFANAANLETLGTGVALATTPAGNGTVPQAEINTLANILAACVNSNGAGSACTTLFANAKSSGSSGTVATDTATAAINIAHNPGTNVAALYGLGTGTPQFAGGLPSQPNDLTVAITFTGAGLAESFSHLAVDGNGNVWIGASSATAAIELSSSGAVLSGTGGYSGNGFLTRPGFVAIDPSGNAWFVEGGTSQAIVELSNSGGFMGSYNASFSGGPWFVSGANGIVADGAGNIWVPTFQGLSAFTNNGLPIAFQYSPYGGGFNNGAADSSGNVWVTPNGLFSPADFLAISSTGAFPLYETGAPLSSTGGGGGVYAPWAIAIDHSGNAWVTNNNDSISEVSNVGVGIALSPPSGFTGGGLLGPYCLSIDGAGNVWVGAVRSENVVEFSNSGEVLSGTIGYRTGDQYGVNTIAVDGSGNVWRTGSALGVDEIIGAAAPVVTPLSVGARDNKLGVRP